jgi:hypothetical protein
MTDIVALAVSWGMADPDDLFPREPIGAAA